jgi:hypothetical protein
VIDDWAGWRSLIWRIWRDWRKGLAKPVAGQFGEFGEIGERASRNLWRGNLTRAAALALRATMWFAFGDLRFAPVVSFHSAGEFGEIGEGLLGKGCKGLQQSKGLRLKGAGAMGPGRMFHERCSTEWQRARKMGSDLSDKSDLFGASERNLGMGGAAGGQDCGQIRGGFWS